MSKRSAGKKSQPRLRDERGAIIILIAVTLVVLLAFTALAVDIGYLYAARNELQNTADASALAAARKLGSIYQDMSYAGQASYICTDEDKIEIIAIAQNVAKKNTAAGDSVHLNTGDIIIGRWKEWESLAPGTPKTEYLNQPDAIHVIARRDASVSNGPVSTFFAKVLGISSADVTAVATAALGGMSNIEPGELELPVGISSVWFQGDFCGEEIKFYPTDSCAGWTGFTYNPNTNNMRQIIDGDIESPAAIAGDTEFDFTGGVAATLFDNLFDLFHENAIWVNEDGNPTTEGNGALVWSTTVVVYKNEDDSIVDDEPYCKNPGGSYQIAGFAKVDITEVLKTPEKSIKGVVNCNYVDSGDSRSGGAYYGVKGSIPGLIQ